MRLNWGYARRDKGWSFPLLLIILIAIVILFIFYGWIILFGVLALFFFITLVVYIYDKIKGKVTGKDNRAQNDLNKYYCDSGNGSSDQGYGIDENSNTCKTCGINLFSIVPGETTRDQIIEFARRSTAWRENPDAKNGCMHPGIYCPNGCVSILADY